MEYVLATHALCKRYKKQWAVRGVDMHIERGDIYGFVGENGSGKTTVIRLITGLIFPCDGSFELFGVSHRAKEIGQARSRVGAIVETPSIYMNMSAYDNLKTQCAIYDIEDDEKIRLVLQEVGLAPLYKEKKHAGDFSLGMRQRLGIAMALLADPEFLILDEPMNGLDPAGIVDIRELILKLNRERGITFLISSHILTELSLIATKYGIISKGKLIKEVTSQQLHNECAKTTDIRTDDVSKLAETVQKTVSNQWEYTTEGIKIYGQLDLNELLLAVLHNGITIQSINCSETSFEDYYLSLIGGANQ